MSLIRIKNNIWKAFSLYFQNQKIYLQKKRYVEVLKFFYCDFGIFFKEFSSCYLFPYGLF